MGNGGRSEGSDFRRARRLPDSGAFEAVLSARQTVRGRKLQVSWVRSGRPLSRLGMVIGKRLAARAVDRNRVRRVIRETFRQGWALKPGVDMVVRLREPLAGASNHELRTELHSLWGRLR